MNALILALAGFLTMGSIHGPLYAVKFEATLVDGKSVQHASVGEEGGLIPLPDDMVKAGWICVFTKSDRPRTAYVSQSIVCQIGNETKSPSISVTAICNTENTDIDQQRLMIGSSDHAIGLGFSCTSLQVAAADNI